jgi:hypothetical protein
MPIGSSIRHLLGARLARRAGRWYRAIFVDLAREAAALASAIPRDAHVLDVGGGDGEPLNHLLGIRPDLKITTLDPGPVVGHWIDTCFNDRVIRLPRTDLAQYLAMNGSHPDAILIADVLHHVPVCARAGFLDPIRQLFEQIPDLRIVVKDVEPGTWRASLGYWSDRYITGDANVSPISREHLVRLLEDALGPLRCEYTNLFEVDRPNYAVAFFR